MIVNIRRGSNGTNLMRCGDPEKPSFFKKLGFFD
jgi:hypothetical protein